MKKSGLKTGDHHAIFSVLDVKRSKILQKLNKETVFVYILGFIFYGVSRAKTYLRNKYVLTFNFVFGSFFLNKIIY